MVPNCAPDFLLSFLAHVAGRRDEVMLGDASIPDRWGSATEVWRENLIVPGIGYVLELEKRSIGVYWLPKITSKTDKSRKGPLSCVVSGIRLGWSTEP